MSGQYSGSYTKSVDITVTTATLEPGFSLAGGISIAVYSTLGTNNLTNFATIDGGGNLDSFGVVLLGSVVNVINEASGYIKVDSYGLGVRSATGSIVNAGTIEAVLNQSFAVSGVPFPVYGAVGILLNQANVTVSNVAGGLVQGAYAGIDGVAGASTIINAGVIRGGYGNVPSPNGGYATRSDFGVGTPNGGITNTSSGTIGGYLGAAGFRTPILNNGLIVGSHVGVTDYYGTISNLDSASIATITGGIGIDGTVADTVINDGVILGTSGAAVELDSFHYFYLDLPPSLDNQAGGTIEGSTAGLYLRSLNDPTITNAGLMQGNDNSEGVKLLFPVDLRNSGTITGANGVLDAGYGAYYGIIDQLGGSFAANVERLASVASSLVNTGTIDAVVGGTGSGAYGVLLRGAATVDNFGVIAGGARGLAIEATRSVSVPGYVLNVGTIGGAGVAGVVLDTGGTLVNAGTISGGYYAAVVFNDASAADRLVLDRNSTITGRILAHGTVGNVLELTDNVELGYPGSNDNTVVSGLGVGISGFDSIQVDGLANWTLAASPGANFTGGVSLLTEAQLTSDIAIAGTISGGVGDVVDNAGQITAGIASAYAIGLSNGGSIINAGTITGAQRAVGISGSPGVIDNTGMIAGGNVVGVQLGAGGTLINAGSIGAGYYASVVFNSSNAARVVLDTGARFGGRVLANGHGGNTVEFAAGTGTIGDFSASFEGFGTLQFDPGAAWRVEDTVTALATDTVTGFGAGDTLVLDGFAANPAQTNFIPDVGLVLANSTAGSLFNIDTASSYNTGNFTVTSNAIADTTTLTVVPCFAAGTGILTMRGEVAVEALTTADVAILHDGAAAPISWIGWRDVDLVRHPAPEAVRPVLIEAGAIAPGMPRRDLLLSPDHALFLAGLLVPAKALINGHTIRQIGRRRVVYYHVELAAHAALLAEGTACESYLDTGNRGAFANGGAAVALHADFAQARRERTGFARFAEFGAEVAAIRRAILGRAGIATTAEPALTIQYMACGDAIIRSRSAIPGYLTEDPRDRRCLGVKVAAIASGDAAIPLDHSALGEGWHDIEPDGRWTDGCAVIPAVLLGGGRGVVITVAATLAYPVGCQPAGRGLEVATGV